MYYDFQEKIKHVRFIFHCQIRGIEVENEKFYGNSP